MNILEAIFDLGREHERLWGAHFDFRGRQQGIYDGQCTEEEADGPQTNLPASPQGW